MQLSIHTNDDVTRIFGLLIIYDLACINGNGPAIWGGCVTRRQHRAVPIAIGTRYFSHKAVTVQGGYGALFAVQVQVLLNITSVAVQVRLEPRPDSYRDYPRLQSWGSSLAQCRGTNYLGARNLSRCRI